MAFHETDGWPRAQTTLSPLSPQHVGLWFTTSQMVWVNTVWGKQEGGMERWIYGGMDAVKASRVVAEHLEICVSEREKVFHVTK